MKFSMKRLLSRIVPLVCLLACSLTAPVQAQTEPPKPTPEVAAIIARANATKDRAEVVRLLNEALDTARRTKDLPGEAYAETVLGLADVTAGKNSEAVQLAQKALEYFQSGTLKPMQILNLATLIQAHARLNDPDKVLKYGQQLLAVSNSPEYEQQKMVALLTIGLVYADKELWSLAGDTLEPTLPYLRKSGDKEQLSIVLGYLSFGFLNTGQYLKAMQYSQQTLALSDTVKNKGPEALALTTLAALNIDLGQFQQGQDVAVKAMNLWHTLGQDQFAVVTELFLADTYRQQQRPALALEYLNKALPPLRKSNNQLGLGLCLVEIGGCYRNLHQSEKSLPYYEEAARFFKLDGNSEWEGEALVHQAEVCRAIGQTQRARDLYQQALTVLNRALTSPAVAGEPLEEASTLYGMAVAEEELGRLADAKGHIDQAVVKAEQFRASIGSESSVKIGFLERILFGYHRAISLQMKSNHPEEAFALVQKIKARALLDLMSGGKVDIRQSLTEEQARRERELRQAADKINLSMVQESVANEVGAKKRYAALKEQLGDAEKALQTYEESLYALHPELAGKRAATTVTVQEIGKLLPEDTALLEFVTLYAKEYPDVSGADHTLLFVVTRQNGAVDLKVFPVDVSRAELTEQVEAFRNECADPRKSYMDRARKLYDLLIRPAHGALANKKRLVICPDGPLWELSFASLHDGKQFLLERSELAYAYSATGVWAELQERGKEPPRKSLLALGNPDFGGAARFGDLAGIAGQRPITAPSRPITAPSRNVKKPSRPITAPSRPITAPSRPITAPSRLLLVPRGGRITMLPGTQMEVDLLRKQFPDATIDTGRAAQESVVKSMAGEYRYVHLASHAFFNDASPLLSSIVLAQPPAGSQDDGFLTAREIFDLNLHADMVVLSACNTARGGKQSGEGIIGLTWALFVAGVPTQVVSQWAVDDASTATLMGAFYSDLKAGKSAALRSAELKLLKDGKHAHPYYWAPFTLMGDWR